MCLHRLLNIGQQVCLAPFEIAARTLRGRCQQVRSDQAKPQTDGCGQRHAPFEKKQNSRRKQHARRRRNGHRDRKNNGIFHRGQIGGEGGEDVAGAGTVVKGHGEPLQMSEHRKAQIGQHNRRQSCIKVVAGDSRQCRQRGQDDEPDTDRQQGRLVARDDGTVDQQLEGQWKSTFVDHVHQQRGPGQQCQTAIGTQPRRKSCEKPGQPLCTVAQLGNLGLHKIRLAAGSAQLTSASAA